MRYYRKILQKHCSQLFCFFQESILRSIVYHIFQHRVTTNWSITTKIREIMFETFSLVFSKFQTNYWQIPKTLFNKFNYSSFDFNNLIPVILSLSLSLSFSLLTSKTFKLVKYYFMFFTPSQFTQFLQRKRAIWIFFKIFLFNVIVRINTM